MPTQQFNNYANLITFTRASSGTALRPISYGAELVVNGTFSSGTSGWVSSGTTLSVVGGRLVVTSTAAGTVGVLYTAGAPYTTGVFEAVFDVEPPAGKTVFMYIRNAAGPTYSNPQVAAMARRQSAGTSEAVSFFWTASAAGEVMYLDNVSVKQVIFDQAGDPLTLFNHPNNVPRIEYDSNGNRLGLLIEEARTNLLSYSEALDNVYWTRSNCTVTPNVSTAPSGEVAADRLSWLSGTNPQIQAPVTTVSAGSAITLSAYAKAGTKNGITLIMFTDGSNYAFVNFNLTTGVAGTPTVAGTRYTSITTSSTPVGDGWYRYSVTSITNTLTAVESWLRGDTMTGSGDNILLYGAQLEVGAFPTSYIPTTGAAATRAVDIASIPTSAFGYNVTAGTFVARVNQPLANRVGARKYIWNISDGGNNRLNGRASDVGNVEPAWAYGTGVAVENINIPVTTGPSHSTALAYSSQNGIAAVNGTLSTLSAGYAGIPQPTLNIGQTVIQQICGYITSIQYYPRQLSPAQIQELTR